MGWKHPHGHFHMIGQILAKSGQDVMTIDDSIDSMIVDVEDLNIGVHTCCILCRCVAHVPLMKVCADFHAGLADHDIDVLISTSIHISYICTYYTLLINESTYELS